VDVHLDFECSKGRFFVKKMQRKITKLQIFEIFIFFDSSEPLNERELFSSQGSALILFATPLGKRIFAKTFKMHAQPYTAIHSHVCHAQPCTAMHSHAQPCTAMSANISFLFTKTCGSQFSLRHLPFVKAGKPH
jgi:hypothetical protein